MDNEIDLAMKKLPPIFGPKKFGFWQKFVDDPGLAQSLVGNPVAAAEAIEQARWPSGPACPICNSTNVSSPAGLDRQVKRRFRCRECARQFNYRHSTFLAGSRVRADRVLLAFAAITRIGPAATITLLVDQTGADQKSSENLVQLICDEFHLKGRKLLRLGPKQKACAKVGAAAVAAGAIWYSQVGDSQPREAIVVGATGQESIVERIPYTGGVPGGQTFLITPKDDFPTDADWVATHAARVRDVSNVLANNDS